MSTNKSTPALAAAIPANVKKYAVWALVAIVIVIGVARIASYVRSDDTLTQSAQQQTCPAFSDKVQKCTPGKRTTWVDTGVAEPSKAKNTCYIAGGAIVENQVAQNARYGFTAPPGESPVVRYWLSDDPSCPFPGET